MEDHRIWPRGGEVVSAEVLVPQRVLCGDLVAFQVAREAFCPAHAVKLEHCAEHLAHDLRRQLASERAGDAVTGEVTIFRLAFHIDSVRVREHVGLLIKRELSVEWCAEKGRTHIMAGVGKVNKDTLALKEREASNSLVDHRFTYPSVRDIQRTKQNGLR